MAPSLEDLRLVTFDLDGTLIDSVPDLAVAVDAVLTERGYSAAGEERVADWVGNGSRTLVKRALCYASGQEPDGQTLDQAHDAFLQHYGRAPSEHTRVFPGVKEALAALHARGMTLAVITNKPHAFIAPILDALALSEYFAYVVGGDSLPQKKPDPAPLLHVAERFSVPPHACLMVGDSRHDIEAGRRAGFRTLAVPYGYNHGEPVADSRPDFLVESLMELV
ncbi:phosphoglycolate phosphatase [Modicisalibacter xianhensis]|uniref:Phosphoglycolate phosphatase n=1 Tax=Modicisalibacter xianhensis TaxID=442341 RepID=A0A4R8FZZ4_9GAMM|nr:phosphoglycolate phosphatase [Halomonas xianhensis]TDX32350.1 phosphoglycolate phosphatase [Halomonas xianhensis]